MRILVTGSSGLLGQSLRAKLPEDLGHEVLWINRNDADLTDSSSFRPLLHKFNPELVIHAAALVGGIKANSNNNLRFYLENTLIDTNVLSACAAEGVARLLYFSSNCTYPIDAIRPIKESSLFLGEIEKTNVGYGEAKLAGVRLCGLINAELGYSYKVLTLANLYGQFDNFDHETSHLVAAVTKKIMQAKIEGRRSVEVWGSGKVKRDFLNAEDVASWIWRELDRVDSFPAVMNLGGHNQLTIDEYYQMIAATFSWPITLEHNLDMPDGVNGKLLDSSLASSRFGWTTPTSYVAGFQKIRDWLEKNE